MNEQILLEHEMIPGTTYEHRLILGGGGGAIFNEMIDLTEAADYQNKVIKFKGKFQEAEAINKNKRRYPFKVLDENVKRLQPALTEGGLCGELDHPTDSIIHFSNASHKITKLWWENNVLMGEGIILNTPGGKILRALINDGVRIGISSRGVGNGKVDPDGVLVIGESYKLITFDAVADPSTYAAFQEKVVTRKRENLDDNPINHETPAKNEDKSIDNINMNLVLACVGGLIKQSANQIKKERLS